MKKHAYLIMAHNQPEILKTIIRILDNEHNDFFIHWDLSAPQLDENEIKKHARYSNIYFIPRMNVKWAGFSQTLCQLSLMEHACQHKQYDYYHLISGVDLPLKTAQEILDFFELSNNLEYIAIDVLKDEYRDRLRYYYLFQDVYGRNRKNPFLAALYIFDIFSVKIQSILGVNRLKNENLDIHKGINWFSLTDECVRYIISKRDWIEKRLKYSKYGDEVFIHTLIWNTPFRDKIFNGFDGDRMQAALRLVDWKRGSPYTFRSEDYDMLIQSKHLFARKFSLDVDADVIKRIEKTLIQKTKKV